MAASFPFSTCLLAFPAQTTSFLLAPIHTQMEASKTLHAMQKAGPRCIANHTEQLPVYKKLAIKQTVLRERKSLKEPKNNALFCKSNGIVSFVTFTRHGAFALS